jgi:hypothetical protein
MSNLSLLPEIDRAALVLIVDDHFNGIYKTIQNLLNVTDGGEASHYHSGDGDDLQTKLVDFFQGYVEHERTVGPMKMFGNELVDARFEELNILFSAYDVTAWSGFSEFYHWNVADADYDRDRYTVELHLFDTRTPLCVKVEFAPHTANIIGVDAPRYLDAYSPYLDYDYLKEARQVEARAALDLYAAGEGHPYDFCSSGFKVDGRNKVSGDFCLGALTMYSHVMTIEFRPHSPDIVHIRIETMEDALYRAEGHGAFCD